MELLRDAIFLKHLIFYPKNVTWQSALGPAQSVDKVSSHGGPLTQTTLVKANQAVIVPKGVKIRYTAPGADGADYIAVCLPAFTRVAANRGEIGWIPNTPELFFFVVLVSWPVRLRN